MNFSTEGVAVELARVIQTLRDGLPARPLPLAVTRAEWDAMLSRGDVQKVDKLDERAGLAGIAIQIVGDKV